MSQTVQLSAAGLGGPIQGNFGTYMPGSDTLITVDTRDAPALLAAGCNYVKKAARSYMTPAAAGVATAGQIVASAAFSAGALAIANQPDVMRQVAVRVDPGTVAITSGIVAITYASNDGLTQTESISCVTAASTILTKFVSKGVAAITTIVASLVTGGASPGVQLDTTATICIPVDPGTVDVTFVNEGVATTAGGAITKETVGTASTATLGGIAPTSAPNATRLFSFGYNYVSPTA